MGIPRLGIGARHVSCLLYPAGIRRCRCTDRGALPVHADRAYVRYAQGILVSMTGILRRHSHRFRVPDLAEKHHGDGMALLGGDTRSNIVEK
eukprot:scaffold1504_cov417-Prasinococcus_capsulatus_cf.AAC.78